MDYLFNYLSRSADVKISAVPSMNEMEHAI